MTQEKNDPQFDELVQWIADCREEFRRYLQSEHDWLKTILTSRESPERLERLEKLAVEISKK